ncbi:MAG: hypothetical protein WA049_06670 [Ferribacterium limneticum]
MFYSKSTGGFYDRAIHGDNIPADAAEISTEMHTELIEGQSKGKRIVADASGFPVLQDPPPPTEAELVAQYESALDAHLDAVAQSYRYADRTRLSLRAGYPNQHQALATAFGTWMDTCNDIAKQRYQEVKAGTATLPTMDEFLALLPAFVAPQP